MSEEGTFIPYPNIDDEDFHNKIFWKKEFHKAIHGPDFQYNRTEDLCKRGEFRMLNHQEFMRNFTQSQKIVFMNDCCRIGQRASWIIRLMEHVGKKEKEIGDEA